jgi:hypothetical protein
VRAIERKGTTPQGLSATDKSGKTELERAIQFFKAWKPKPSKPKAKKPKGAKKPKTPKAAKAANGSFEFKAYKSADVKLLLESLFSGKCAYCESFYSETAPVDIEHFRPKGAIEGEPDHPGYWWLAMDWDNLLPSCIDCNRKRKQITPKVTDNLLALMTDEHERRKATVMNTGKKDTFPVAGPRAKDYAKPAELAAEQAFLLNPCIDKPDEHLDFLVDPNLPISLVVPRGKDGVAGGAAALPAAGARVAAPAVLADANTRKLSTRGAISIQVYGLNRLALVQSRTRLLRRLEFLADIVIELHAIAQQERDAGNTTMAKRVVQLADRVATEIKSFADPKEPHSAVAVAWLARFRKKLEA